MVDSVSPRSAHDAAVSFYRGCGRSVLKLSHYGIDYFIDGDSSGRVLVVAAFVEKFLQEVARLFSSERHSHKSPTGSCSVKSVTQGVPVPQSKMHRQAVAADQAPVISDISEVLEQRWPFRENIDRQACVCRAPSFNSP